MFYLVRFWEDLCKQPIGSYAYGQPNQNSDVDLCVILDTDLSDTERTVVISELLLPRPFPMDIIVKTPDEVKEELHQNNYFTREIIQNGRVLYAKAVR